MTMADNIRFTHLNASSFVKLEVQHTILRQLGKKIHFLNVVETHTTPQLESSLRNRYLISDIHMLSFTLTMATNKQTRKTAKKARRGQ